MARCGAVRAAWSHIFYPVKSEKAGKPFDLEHSLISTRERSAIPVVVYQKISGDGIALEKLGSERLWQALGPIWPEDRPHLGLSEVAGWFATYVYLPKVRDRVALESSIRDTVAKLDPLFRLRRWLRRSEWPVHESSLGQECARVAPQRRGARECVGSQGSGCCHRKAHTSNHRTRESRRR